MARSTRNDDNCRGGSASDDNSRVASASNPTRTKSRKNTENEERASKKGAKSKSGDDMKESNTENKDVENSESVNGRFKKEEHHKDQQNQVGEKTGKKITCSSKTESVQSSMSSRKYDGNDISGKLTLTMSVNGENIKDVLTVAIQFFKANGFHDVQGDYKLSYDAGGPGTGKQANTIAGVPDPGSTTKESKDVARKKHLFGKNRGPMARLDDSDFADSSNECASDSAAVVSRPKSSSSSSKKPGPPSKKENSSSKKDLPKTGAEKKKLEVVGHGFGSYNSDSDTDSIAIKTVSRPVSAKPSSKKKKQVEQSDEENLSDGSSTGSWEKCSEKSKPPRAPEHKSKTAVEEKDKRSSNKKSIADHVEYSDSDCNAKPAEEKQKCGSSENSSHNEDSDGCSNVKPAEVKRKRSRNKKSCCDHNEDKDDCINTRERNIKHKKEDFPDNDEKSENDSSSGPQPENSHGDEDSAEESDEKRGHDEEGTDGGDEGGDEEETHDHKVPEPKSSFRTEQRFSSNRPWAGAIVAPSNSPPVKGEIPNEELVLEFVHGYRTREVKNNAFYLAPGLIVFPAGALGIVMDTDKKTQRFFQGRHKEEVTAITVHPSKRFVATGDIVSHSDGAYIYIWDPISPEDLQSQVQIRVGDKKLARGVSDLKFSPDGIYLVASAMDDDHTIFFYDWKNAGKVIAKEKGHTDSIFGIEFNPKAAYEFITFGIKHLKLWTFDAKSNKMNGTRGLFGNGKADTIICATYLPNGNFATGTHSGDILYWSGNQVVKVIPKIHDGPVFSLLYNGKLGLISAGRDGHMILHDTRTMNLIHKIELESGVRSLDISSEGKLLVGLEDSILLEIRDFGDKSSENIKRIIEGHSAKKNEELWGCAVNPVNSNEFVTSGDDSMVFKRDVESFSIIASNRLQGKLRGLACSSDGKYVAVGNDFGDIFILKSLDLSQVHFQKYDRKAVSAKGSIHAIENLRFSPDNKYLAVASHDCVVYIWEMGGEFKLIGDCRGHSSWITHLDWSKDGSILQTNSRDYELLFWSIPSCKQITSASSFKDIEWDTFSCIIGWSVRGIWEKGMEGNDISCVDRHPKHSCLVSGDDFLNVKLHIYPASRVGFPSKSYLAHGSHITNVVFTRDGNRLISTGGMDGITCQWRVEGVSHNGNDEDEDEEKGD